MKGRAGSALLTLALLTGTALSAPGAVVPTDYADQPVAGGLDQPSSFAFLPDTRILVAEQITGRVRLVVQGAVAPAPILTLPDLNTFGQERGLLGIAVDPRWPASPYVYLAYTRAPGNTTYLTRFRATGALSDSTSDSLSLGDRYDVLVDIPDDHQNHNAGTLRFDNAHMLYMSVGDDSNQCTAQDSSDFRGVILRMNVTALPDFGSGPADKALLIPWGNPFPITDPEAALTFAFGLRNPFRFSIDRVNRVLYVGDVGLAFFEEFNEVHSGDNLGWPFREGAAVRTTAPCPEPGGAGSQDYTGPIDEYFQAQPSELYAVVGGPFYRFVNGGEHSFHYAYDGTVFYSDYYQGFLRALRRVNGVWTRIGDEPGQPNPNDWGTGFETVVDYAVGQDGAIYYLRQFPGELRRIVHTAVLLGADPDPNPAPTPRLILSRNPWPASTGPLGIGFSLAEAGPVTLAVFDVRGRRLDLILSRDLPPGPLHLTWDGRDGKGSPVPPGRYYLRLDAGGVTSHHPVTRLP